MQQVVLLDLVLAGFTRYRLPEGSQVPCVLRQLLVHKLPGAVHPSRSLHLFVVELQHDVLQVLRRFHWSRQFAQEPTRFQV